MSKQLQTQEQPYVLKDRSAIHVAGNITAKMMKCWNGSLKKAYHELPNKDVEEHTIPWGYLDSYLGIKDRNHAETKNIFRKLMTTPVVWDLLNEDGDTDESTMLSSVKFRRDGVKVSFSPVVRERCYKPEIYARILEATQNKLQGYAFWHYELGMSFYIRKKGYGETPWLTEEAFRQLLHVEEGKYEDFKELNKKVIKKPLEKVNEVAEINIKPEYRREGRKVKFIKLKVYRNPKFNSQVLLDTPELDDDDLQSFEKLKDTLLNEGLSEREITKFKNEKGIEYLQRGLLLLSKQKIRESRKQWLLGCYSSKDGYDFSVLKEGQENKEETDKAKEELAKIEAKEHAELEQIRNKSRQFDKWSKEYPAEYEELAQKEYSRLSGFYKNKLEKDSKGDIQEAMKIFKSDTIYRKLMLGQWQNSESVA